MIGEILMKHEKSCGAVVFTRTGGEIRYILVQSRAGHYGFPKGHVEPGETEEETALREIFEEVRLRPVFLDGFREVTEYTVPASGARKEVVFFLGFYKDQEITAQESELRQAVSAPYEAAMALLEHEDSRKILAKADYFLKNTRKDNTNVQ